MIIQLTQLTSKMTGFMLEMNQFILNTILGNSKNGMDFGEQSLSSEQLETASKVSQIKIKPSKANSKEKPKFENPKPKGPTSSFLIYYHQNKVDLGKKYGETNVSNLTKLASREWKTLLPRERQQYQQKSNQSKLRYQKEMQVYKEKHADQLKEETKRKRLEYRMKWMNKKKAKEAESREGLPQDIDQSFKLSEDDQNQLDMQLQEPFRSK